MKVSVPVGPPPELPPNPLLPVGPEAATAAPDAPAAEQVVLAQWPEWYRPVDIALAILAAILAFLMASYTARNSDIFRHIGTGRLILNGHHPIGSDPLSFTGADRPWVNSSWLFDIFLYLAYSADDTGVAAVVIKAVVFAAAFGILFLLRRPEKSLWPWAMVAALGIIASGLLASLRPVVFGMLFLSVILALLYRGNWNGPKWRMPLFVGGVCWLWSCTDTFFFLGPLTVFAIWLGEKLHVRFTAGQVEADPAEDPFWTPPPEPNLRRALYCALAGMLLNPMFLGAFVRGPREACEQLIPFELTFGWADLFESDKSLLSATTLSPINPFYFESAELGNNIAGYTGLALIIGSAALLGIGLTRLRATHVLLWFVFVALGLLHYRFIPFAMLAAVPLTAGHLNGLSRFKLQGIFDSTTKTVLTLSGVGRIVSVTVLLLLIGLTIPGKLHAKVTSTKTAYNRRVSWGIEEEVGLSRGAKLVQQWRDDGSLPEESHGILSSYDLGDYCICFAPKEKVFIDSRLRFHRKELVDLAEFRNELRRQPLAESPADNSTEGKYKALAEKYKADYYFLGQRNERLHVDHLIKIDADFTDVNGQPASRLLHLDGRVAVICRIDTDSGRRAASKLAYSIEKDTFGPDAATVPPGQSNPPLLPVEGWVAEFMSRPIPGSIATDDAVQYSALGGFVTQRKQQEYFAYRHRAEIAAVGGGGLGAALFDPGPRIPTGEELAYATMAIRSARRAVVETPDDPEPYYALFQAFSMNYTGALNPKDQIQNQTTSLRRFLDRIPATPNGPERFLQKSLEAELTLAILHWNAEQYDLGLEVFSQANAKIKSATEADLPPPGRINFVANFFRQKALEQTFRLPTGSLGQAMNRGEPYLAEAIVTIGVQIVANQTGRMPTNEEGLRMYKGVLAELASSNFDAGEKADNPKPRDAGWVRARAQAIEDRLKRETGKRNEAYTQETKSAGIAQKFMSAVNVGFPAKAMDLIFSESDWDNVPQSQLDIRIPRQVYSILESRFGYLLGTASSQEMPDGSYAFRTSALGLNLQAIALQLESGQLDKAVQQCKNVTEVLDKAELENTKDPRIAPSRAALKQLRTWHSRLEGDTQKISADLFEDLRAMPKLPPETIAQLKMSLNDYKLPLAAVAGAPTSILDPVRPVRGQLAREAALEYEIAWNALMAGDNKTARERFRMVLDPQGVSLAALNIGPDEPVSIYAKQYFLLLQRFADPAPR